jgi:Leucine-rich repeat (LRR) protein
VHLAKLSKLTDMQSRNKLPMEALDIISQIPTLRELKLADNGLTGDLPESLTLLTALEVLEIQSNKLTSLPAEIKLLAHLRILNLSENQFTTLPSDLFSLVPLVELIATKNAFSGSFFNVDKAPHLQKLVLSNNTISSFCESGSVSLPALKHLDLGVNRLSSLPDISSWTSLTTLLIGNNKLSTLPEGFVSLQQTLQHADFTSNDIKTIDEKIALMDALKVLVLAANPLRVRKYLTMNTTDLKQDLHSRLEPEEVEVVPQTETGAEIEGFADVEKSGWQLKQSGVLDLSNQNMTEIDKEALVTFTQSNDVRQLYLQQNALTTIPIILSQFDHLSVLDLSRNDITCVLTESLLLPKLRELRLMKNKMQSLDDIMLYLSAPSLQHLDISLNRISGSLPIFRSAFPELLILHMSDNKINEVSADALKGLKIVNLCNNEIPRLEPQIGQLGDTLTNLSVDGNKFRVPNYALLSKGTEAVLAWLRGRIPSPSDEFFSPPSTPDRSGNSED